MDFHKIWYLIILTPGKKIQVSLESGLLKGPLSEDRYTFLSHAAHFFLECEMFWTKFVEKIKTTFFAQYLYF
jgi:hypothetical protein